MIRIIYLIKKEKRSTFFNATPVPLATACKGSSAMWKGMLILSVKRLSSPRKYTYYSSVEGWSDRRLLCL